MKVLLFGALTVLSSILVLSMEKSENVPFEGHVKLHGAPLKDGLIMLYPEKGTVSAQMSAKIVDGKFRLDGRHGPVPGEYSVAIYEFEGSKAKDTIPSQFNTDSILKVQVPRQSRFKAEFNL